MTGDTLFRRESGAVASQFHDPPSIEPYSSELVSAERGIVLGKKSGIDSIRIKVEELGLDVDRFEADRRSDAVAERVARDFRSGIRAGVVSTPTLFVGEKALSGFGESQLAELLGPVPFPPQGQLDPL